VPTKNLTAIVGLPGSGKSFYIAEHFPRGVFRFDDIGDDRTWGHDAWRRNKIILRSVLANGGRAVVIDVGFCDDKVREDFQRGFPEVEWVFFANDPQRCEANTRARYAAEGGLYSLDEYLGTIRFRSEQYGSPPNAIPVYRPQ
jgi:hypothetical protein